MIEAEIKKKLENWQQIISEYQIPNTKRAVIQLANTFLPFLSIWVLMYFSLEWSYWLTLALGIINAFFLARIFIIQHDCGHASFLKSKRWNNAIGFFCSFFSSIPYKYWARVHSYHHSHSSQLEYEDRDVGDIKFLTVKEFASRSWWGKFRYRVFRHPLVMFGITPSAYLFIFNRYPVFSFKGWDKTKRSQLINNLTMLGVYLLLGFTLGWKKFLLIQVPLLMMFGAIAFWFFYVQHQHEYTYKAWKNNWDHLVASIRGSTYYKIPRVFQWLTGNISFHHIHHLNSRIPNYNLERCANENPILQKYVTVLTFRESLKCMFVKLWDEEKNKMISFKEYYRLQKQFA